MGCFNSKNKYQQQEEQGPSEKETIITSTAKQNAKEIQEVQTHEVRGETATGHANAQGQGQSTVSEEDNLNNRTMKEQSENNETQNNKERNDTMETAAQSDPEKQKAYTTQKLAETKDTEIGQAATIQEEKQSRHEAKDFTNAQTTEERQTSDIQEGKQSKHETTDQANAHVTEAKHAADSQEEKQSRHDTKDAEQEQTQSGPKNEQLQREAEGLGDSSQAQPVPPERTVKSETITALRTQVEKDEKEKEELKKKIDDLEEELTETRARADKIMESNKGKSNDHTAKKVAELRREVTKLKTEKNDKQQEIQNKIKEIKHLETTKSDELDLLKRENENLVKSKELTLAKKAQEIEKLEKEKEELLLRLSAMAGRRLTDNNPDIADLSDINRPTKLAEKYSELYDNEWTDAFSYLQTFDQYKESEKEVISALLTMLTTAYKVSLKTAANQLEALRNILNDFRGNTDKDQHVKDVMKQLKDYRKRIIQPNKNLTEEYRREVKKAYPRIPPPSFDPGALKSYLEKCLELCWLMVIQDPPVHLQCDSSKRGDRFDKNVYKEYTKAGPFVLFTVWPAVFLEKDGALLCKGVVQCDKNLSGSLRQPNTPIKGPVRQRKTGSFKTPGEPNLTTLQKDSKYVDKNDVSDTFSTETQDSEGSTNL